MKTKDRGIFYERTKHNPREKAFADAWERENNHKLNHAINFGKGLLQDLFMESHPTFGRAAPTCLHHITDDERFVAATVVQWLGTNCGMSFLETSLNKCGYKVTKL